MKNFYRILLAASLVAASLAAPAEDIDLFMGYPPGTKELPNVMIVLDNAADFSSNAAGSSCKIDGVPTALSGTVGGIEQCALYQVISNIPTSDPNDASVTATVNIGMMVYNATNIRDVNNANCGGTVGGCLAQPLITLNAANKTALLAWIKSWNTTGGAGNGYIKANSEADGAAMQETWAYFAGRTGLSGRNYSGIKPPTACNKSYIIFVGNSYSSSGTPGDQTGNKGPKNALEGTNSTSSMNASPAATTDQKALITDTIKTTCQNNAAFTFPTSSHENKGYYADEWARYLSAHSITTYSIGVLGNSCQAEYAALLTSMADLGGGKYFPTTDYTGLVLAFSTILSEIQSVNSVFASVSLPASVNTQGTYLNQVYVGMFRPDKDGLPRWPGNLKQYRLGMLNGTLQLLDAHTTLTSAISSNGTGFIAECALSYWTPTTDDDYWAWNNTPNCIGHPASSNTPDGNFVEKGGQGYVLRGPKTATSISRNIQTCDGSCSGLTVFDTSNGAISKAALGDSSMTDAARTDLINWARGLNNNIDETFAAATAMRPSVHGDVVHSRPVALNFGSTASPQVVVFYGGNDGVLRAVNGNRTGSIGSVAAGGELWSFVAPEFYGSIKRLRDNKPPISFKGSTFTGALPKPYGVDGPITADKDATHAWIYVTMRRGGRVMYAFDVTSPASPSLKWKIGCPNNFPTSGTVDDTGCTSNLTGIGQTWSSAVTLKASGYGGGASPILIMGGGYDTCEDTDDGTVNNSCTSSSKGNHIYVLDADTGTWLKTLDTDRGVVGNVTVVPDISGLAKYAYAADLGGNVYRIDIGSAIPSNWTITKIASLGCADTTSCNPNRKFLFGPDVVEENGTTYLLVGSGDREKPLLSFTATTTVVNYFFMIKDKPNDPTWLSTGTCSGVICLTSLTQITAGVTQSTLDASKGWYLGLNDKEQVVTSAITLSGNVTFSTHQPAVPDPNTCTSGLGIARAYNIKYLNATSSLGQNTLFQTVAGGGLAPSPVAGYVTLGSDESGTGQPMTVPFVIGGNPQSSLQVSPTPRPPPGSAGTQPKSRVYWYIQQ